MPDSVPAKREFWGRSTDEVLLRPFCRIVVPCYNEEQRLKVEEFAGFLRATTSVNFLFVNDGSTDRTIDLLEGLKAEFPDRVDILNLKVNGGKAGAVRAGLLHQIPGSSPEIVGFWDADLATPLSAILDMAQVFQRRPQTDMVFGSRVRLLGREIHRRPARHYLGRIFATQVSLLLRLPIYDTQCGAKLFRVTPEFESVLSRPFRSKWIFDVELLARYLRLHRHDPTYPSKAIYEYPLQEWHDVAGSRLRKSDFLKAIAELFSIWQTEIRDDPPGTKSPATGAFGG